VLVAVALPLFLPLSELIARISDLKRALFILAYCFNGFNEETSGLLPISVPAT
jgi:hypothetical protein